MREMGLRFPKSVRLSRAAEFQRMRADGMTMQGKFMLLSVLPNAAAGSVKVGIITSRRVGAAVDRNRVRRRLREIVRAEMARIFPGTWVVIVARHRAVGVAFSELREEWLRLVRRASVMRPDL